MRSTTSPSDTGLCAGGPLAASRRTPDERRADPGPAMRWPRVEWQPRPVRPVGPASALIIVVAESSMTRPGKWMASSRPLECTGRSLACNGWAADAGTRATTLLKLDGAGSPSRDAESESSSLRRRAAVASRLTGDCSDLQWSFGNPLPSQQT